MWRSEAGCAILAALALCRAAEPVTADPIPNLARVRAQITSSLTHLPNYTCEERIARYEQMSERQEPHLVDRVRLEVAFVGGREMFGWPGASHFEEKPLESLLSGTTGTGAFAALPIQVFGSKLPTFEYKPEESAKIRYDYQYPLVQNGFTVGVGDRRGNVGFHGSFYLDRPTGHLLRLELQADHIPQHVPLSDMRLNLDYQVIHLDGRDYLAPRVAEQIMVTTSGYSTRNVTTFSQCHQFRGESVVKFEDVDGEVHSSTPTQFVTLPAKVSIDAVLNSAVKSNEPAIGDPIEAVVSHEVKSHRDVLLPKGAILSGRITRLRYVESGIAFYAVGVLFHTARFGNTEAHLNASLVALSPNAKMSARAGRWLTLAGPASGLDRLQDDTFFVRGREFELPRGTHLYLSTRKENP